MDRRPAARRSQKGPPLHSRGAASRWGRPQRCSSLPAPIDERAEHFQHVFLEDRIDLVEEVVDVLDAGSAWLGAVGVAVGEVGVGR